MVRGKGLFTSGISLIMILSLCSYSIWSVGPMSASRLGSTSVPRWCPTCQLHDRVLQSASQPHVLHWLSLWLCAYGLPLNSLLSLSKSLCRAASSLYNFLAGQFVEPPHKFVGPIPFRFQECLWPQRGMSTFAVYPEGRRGSPGLPFSLLLLHKRGTLVLYLRGTHYCTHLSFLFGRCGTSPGARQIDLPQNWVPSCCLGSPSGTYILPLFSLMMQHARTFCVE